MLSSWAATVSAHELNTNAIAAGVSLAVLVSFIFFPSVSIPVQQGQQDSFNWVISRLQNQIAIIVISRFHRLDDGT